MDIMFSSNKLRRQLSESKVIDKAYGRDRAKRVRMVMNTLRAAPNLGVFAPPYSKPYRCHELKGNRKGQFALDLGHPFRLTLCPMDGNDLEDGKLNWQTITVIQIKKVEDYHG